MSHPLANAELAVMDLLWQNDRMTARDLREQLYPDASKAQHGTVSVEGTVAPILSLGAGFDHELSGRENILLNSLLLGHTRREARERQDSIVEFSELQRAIDSPLKKIA